MLVLMNSKTVRLKSNVTTQRDLTLLHEILNTPMMII